MRKSKCKSRVNSPSGSRDTGEGEGKSYPGGPECNVKDLVPENESVAVAANGGNEQFSDLLSDSLLFDLSMTVFDKTGINGEICDESSSTSTPLTSKRSQKSPYRLRSPSVANRSLYNKDTSSDFSISLSKNIRKRLKNKSNRLMSPIPEKVNKLDQSNSSCCMSINEPLIQSVIEMAPVSDGAGSFYGLPGKTRELFKETRGISSLFDWQHECLNLKCLSERRNLIYSLPTSGGKTLVAEILLLKEILVNQSDALFVFPFVSIVQEKLKGFIPFASEFDFVLDEYAGSKGCIPPKRRRKNTLFLGTIEKAHILLNSLIESNSLDRIGLVVVDELHMLGERDRTGSGGRGSCLEVMLCKLMHVSKSTQIIGMSATLKNMKEVAEFLKAEIYTNNFRPVALKQMVKFSDTIFLVNSDCQEENLFKLEKSVAFNYTKEQVFKDPDHVVGLCSEVIPQSSCLVFCSSKKNCENVASLICSFMPPALKLVNQEAREALVAELQSDADGNLCVVLKLCIPYGVAYHHSGLTMDERKAIEEAYLQNTLCLLCCTSTLAAGVNLPAKRVIIRSPYVGRDFMNPTQYKQMIGRAGRTGLVSEGESILIVNKSSDRSKIEKLVRSPAQYCRSELLSQNKSALKQVILSLIGLKICSNLSDVDRFLKCTLAAKQQTSCDIDLDKVVQELVDCGLLRIAFVDSGDSDERTPLLNITQIGTACYRSSLSVETVSDIYCDLEKASKHLVVDSFIHLLYVCVPCEACSDLQVNWNLYLKLFSSLSAEVLTCATVLGVSEMLLVAKATGTAKTDSRKWDHVLLRFYCALILNDLIALTNIWDVAKKFNLSRGFVQTLLTSASSFCFQLTQFCKNLSVFWALTELLQVVQKKLNFNFSQELHALLEIPRVKYGRAKQLYNAGYKTLASVAQCNPIDMIKALEGKITLKACRNLVQGAKMILKEKIDSLRDEEQELVANSSPSAMKNSFT